MNIAERLTADLVANGFTIELANEIVDRVIHDTTPCMANRWHDDICRCPTVIYKALWCRCKKLALTYLCDESTHATVSLNFQRYNPLNQQLNH